MICKDYEKFLKLNNLSNNLESALQFIDIAEIKYLDVNYIIESYIDYSHTLKTSKAKYNNLMKAFNLDNERIKTRIELAILLISSKGYFNPHKYFNEYKDIEITIIDFIENELDKLNKKFEMDRISSEELYEYLTELHRLFFIYKDIEDYDDAINIGEKMLALDEKDRLDISSTIPYLYLNVGNFNDFELIVSSPNIADISKHLSLSIYYFMKNDLDNAFSHLMEVREMNKLLLKYIAIGNDIPVSQIGDEDYQKEAYYYFVEYRFLNKKISDEYRLFVVKNYKYIE